MFGTRVPQDAHLISFDSVAQTNWFSSEAIRRGRGTLCAIGQGAGVSEWIAAQVALVRGQNRRARTSGLLRGLSFRRGSDFATSASFHFNSLRVTEAAFE